MHRSPRSRGSAALLALLALLVVALSGAIAEANSAYFGFHVQGERSDTGSGDESFRLVPSPKPYVFHTSFEFLGLNGAQDLFYDRHRGTLWVADTNNNRVVELTKDGQLLREIRQLAGFEAWEAASRENFSQLYRRTMGVDVGALEGAELSEFLAAEKAYVDQQMAKYRGRTFSRPEGIFVNEEGEIFVADTANKRIVILHPDGTLKQILPEPANILLGEDFDYQPSKLVQDHRDYLYVVNKSDYRGMLTLDAQGEFRGFFAPNKVGFTLRRVLIRLFASEAQRQKLGKELPPPHSNIFLSPEGDIYTSSEYELKNQIKKLNPVGSDVMNRKEIGDGNYGFALPRGDQVITPKFVDLTVNSDGIISAVDAPNGIIYQYDSDRNLLTMFGGRGEENGKFGFPTSIETDEQGLLYVLDKDRNNIQVFRPTHFAQLVHSASGLYVEGQYALAAEPWKEALKLNTNYNLAHRGLGKAYDKLGLWEEALVEYRFGEDRVGYSEVFAKLRHEWIRDHFGLFVLLVVLASVAIYFFVQFMKWLLRRPWEEAGPVTRTVQMLWTVALHPYEGFWMLKREGKGSLTTALVLVALVFGVRIADIMWTSYQIGDIDPRNANLLVEVVRIIVPWILWCVCNYGVTTITDGEGFFRDNVIATAYAFGPYLMTKPIGIALSHILTRTEKSYIESLDFAAVVWVAILIIIHVQVTHNFSLRKTFGTAGLTLFGMICFIAVAGLAYTLTDQIFRFAREVAIELTIRG